MTANILTAEKLAERLNSLWRNVAALGGSADNPFDKGWVGAISCTLKELGYLSDETVLAEIQRRRRNPALVGWIILATMVSFVGLIVAYFQWSAS